MSKKSGFLFNVRRLLRLTLSIGVGILTVRAMSFLFDYDSSVSAVFGIFFMGILSSMSFFSYFCAKNDETRLFTVIWVALMTTTASLTAFLYFGGINSVILTSVLGINLSAFFLWIAMVMPLQYTGKQID